MINEEAADLLFEKIATEIPTTFDAKEVEILQGLICSPVGLKALIRVYNYVSLVKEQAIGIDNSTPEGQHAITKLQGRMAGGQEVIMGLISLITIPQENKGNGDDLTPSE